MTTYRSPWSPYPDFTLRLALVRRSDGPARFALSISLKRPLAVRFAYDLPERDFTRSRLPDERFLAMSNPRCKAQAIGAVMARGFRCLPVADASLAFKDQGTNLPDDVLGRIIGNGFLSWSCLTSSSLRRHTLQ